MKDNKRSKGFNHFILTRYNIPQWDGENYVSMYSKPVKAKKWMDDRLELFEKTRESVLSQDGDFRWIISFDNRTPESVIDAIVTDKRMTAISSEGKYQEEIVRYMKGQKLKGFVITSRMDNDDIYLPGVILAIQDSFQPQVYVIDIDYIQHDIINNEKYTSGNATKHEAIRVRNNGPFLSLVELANHIRTCYCRPHSVLIDGYPGSDGTKAKISSKKINTVFAEMIIHSENMMNKITGVKI